ncbi:MAG: DNA mismatch repair endonuclease MutL [bacterium]
MNRIKRLPQDVIQHIAAGEVVERPASVVKELLENSIDAGARHVYVNIVQGGKRRIEVRDDGVGISREDIPFVFERYSTSKIDDIKDLYRISTLGFRGEALSSIALVSKVILETNTGDEGIKYVIEGGIEKSLELSFIPKGTRIIVEDLFYNTPARRKFLKNDTYEKSLAVDWVRRYALIYPEISFRLESDGEEVFVTPGTGIFKDVASILFEEMLEPIEINFSTTYLSGRGIIERARMYPDRKREVFAINGRVIRLYILQKVVEDAVTKAIGDKGFPFIILDLKMPSSFIDVNIHPAKLEIKILEEGKTYSAVYNAIYDLLKEKQTHYPLSQSIKSASSKIEEALPVYERTLLFKETEPIPTDNKDIFPLEPIGQYLNTFIICSSDKGLFLVDQHVAHERVIFDSFGEIKSIPQLLLEPEYINLSHIPYEEIELIVKELNELGFECDISGPESIVVRAIPSFLDRINLEEALLEPLEEKDLSVNTLKREIACKSAVKLGDRLTMEEMRKLLDDLSRVNNFRFCPHGRPIIIELISREDIFKKFRR